MSEITNQLTQLADEIEVLTKLRRETFSKAIMAQFAGTNVKSVTFELYTEDDDSNEVKAFFGASINVITPECISWKNEGPKLDEFGYIFHGNDNYNNIDIMEHGNAGAQFFLNLGVELELWNQILAEITNNSDDIVFMFDLIPDGSLLYISNEGWWVSRASDELDTE